MASYLTDLLDRCAALQIEAMASISVTADAKPYFFHQQETFPYFTNRINDIPITGYGTGEEDENEDQNTVDIIMRLVIGHITSGFPGERESELYTYLPVVKSYFQQREMLQSVAYPTEMTNMFYVRVVNGGGLRAFENAGISTIQVGAEITLRCFCVEPITQVYL